MEDDSLALVQRPFSLVFLFKTDITVVALSMPSANHAPSRTQGITKVLFFKAGPVRLLLGWPGHSSREMGETSEGVWPSLSPASSEASLWGGHNCGLYNMGYCWCWLVTLDEVFKEFSLSCLVSIKILQFNAWLPDGIVRTIKLGGTV